MLPIRDFMPDALAAALREAPLSDDKVALAWKFAVGPATARATTAVLHGHTLHVTARDAAWCREVERSERLILERLALILGSGTVGTLIARPAR